MSSSYKPMVSDVEFRTLLGELSKVPSPGTAGTTFQLYTGRKGAEQIDHIMKLQFEITQAELLLKRKLITELQRDNLIKMLKSPDLENFELATELIKIKTNGTNL